MDISKVFKNPTNEYRIAPFYFINHKIQKNELLRQINEMFEKGIGGIVFHARHGLLTEYMGEEWMECLEFTIEECKKRDMYVWLYDEDNWPSGTHGGEVTIKNPQYRMRHLRIVQIDINNESKDIIIDAEDKILKIYACILDKQTDRITKQKEITEKELKLINEKNSLYNKIIICYIRTIDAKISFNDAYYLDTMNQEAVNEFIRLAYKPYERFSQYFGNTIQGVFTDEPSIMGHEGFVGIKALKTCNEDLNSVSPGFILPWTRQFNDFFYELMNYNILDNLVGLIYDIGENTQSLRNDYYSAITQLYKKNYHENIANWCNKRNLKYIGHTTEDPLWGQVRSQGNQTQVLKTFDYPGYDYLTAGIGSKENPHRIIAAKCASSIAIVEGKKRVLCESFGGAGHENTIANRITDANFMSILGTNLFIPHAFYYSLAGYRKTDWPSTDFYHAPFWQYYKEFADYLARLSFISSMEEHITKIAVISPITTIYNEIFDNGKANIKMESDYLFSFISDRLLRYQRDYHFLDESQLNNAKVLNSKLLVGKRKLGYETIILPGTKLIYEKTKNLLCDLLDNGGKIIFIGYIPEIYGKDKEYNRKINKIFNEHTNVVLIKNNELLEDDFKQYIYKKTSGNIKVAQNNINCEDIICSKRAIDGCEINQIMNISNEDKMVTIKFKTNKLYFWNLFNGTINKIIDVINNSIDILIQKNELIVISEGIMKNIDIDEISKIKLKNEKNIIETINLSDKKFKFKLKDANVLPLTKWYVDLDNKGVINREKSKVGQINLWTTTFEIKKIPSSIKIVLDTNKQRIPAHHGFLAKKRSLEVYINGNKLGALKSSTWQDIYYIEKDILEYVKKGENQIQIKTISLLEPMHSFTSPAYIIGDFSLKNDVIIEKVLEFNDSWTNNGYPYYSGIGSYSTDFIIKGKKDNYILRFDNINDGASIKINDKFVGIILVKPYQVDISKYIQEGKNTIKINVFNSLSNLYNRNIKQSGLQGNVYIDNQK